MILVGHSLRPCIVLIVRLEIMPCLTATVITKSPTRIVCFGIAVLIGGQMALGLGPPRTDMAVGNLLGFLRHFGI